MAQVKDYNVDLQQLMLEMLLNDAESFVRVQNIFNPNYFDRTLRPAAKFMKEYSEEYKTLPAVDIVNSKSNIQLKDANNKEQKHYDWLLDEFEEFCRHKALEGAILTSADMLEKGEYGSVEDKIKEAVQIGLTKDLGLDYFEDPKSRLMALKDNNGTVSTGWPGFDKKLFGGFNRGELNIFAGGSGAGKSLFLQNMAINWAEAGLNVVYITLELSELLTSMRLDAMMSSTPKTSGKMRIKYLPSGSTVLDLRAFVKEFEIQHGCKVDALCIDYMDLMMPKNKRVSPSDLFVKDKYVSEELRNLAVELQILFVTASQLNRGAVEEIEFDHSHIAGGLSKIQTADNVIGIFTSRAMRERGRYQIQFMKTRSSSGVGQKVDLEFDVDSLRIRDLADDPEYKQFDKQRSTIYDSLKQTSKVSAADGTPKSEVPDPRKGDTVGKVKATVEGGKLRQLLNELHSDEEQ